MMFYAPKTVRECLALLLSMLLHKLKGATRK
jgi:hypothetical protein